MQFTGFATLKIDGDVLDTNGGASLDLGGVVRTAVVDATIVGSNRVLGWAQTPKQARLECEVFVSEKTSLQRFADIEEATITFTADTGNTWILPNAWLAEPPKFTQAGEGGKVNLIFEAAVAEEVS